LQVWRLAWNLITYAETYKAITYKRSNLFADGKRQILWAAEYLQRIHYNETNLIAFVRPPLPEVPHFVPFNTWRMNHILQVIIACEPRPTMF